MINNITIAGFNDNEKLVDLIKFDSGNSIYQALYIAGQHSIYQIKDHN